MNQRAATARKLASKPAEAIRNTDGPLVPGFYQIAEQTLDCAYKAWARCGSRRSDSITGLELKKNKKKPKRNKNAQSFSFSFFSFIRPASFSAWCIIHSSWPFTLRNSSAAHFSRAA